jgi:hypothetical protein
MPLTHLFDFAKLHFVLLDLFEFDCRAEDSWTCVLLRLGGLLDSLCIFSAEHTACLAKIILEHLMSSLSGQLARRKQVVDVKYRGRKVPQQLHLRRLDIYNGLLKQDTQ